ncbi:MAG: DUF1579 domain-containing protein [Verrucomicrobiota bacterium]
MNTTETNATAPASQSPCCQMPGPVKEHAWLQQFVGEWETEGEIDMEPGNPPIKVHGSESTRLLGGFWVVGDGKSEMPDMPFENRLTIGYDPEKQKYVGSWIDSMTGYFWKYEGTVDASGTTLTLNTQGPCPKTPGQLASFKEVTEFKNPDHRIFTSSIQGEDGHWTQMVVIHYRRKK